MRFPFALALAAIFVVLAGCQPEIGDSCSNSIDCSANNTRICDTASEKGYCTIRGCDPDSCPGGALCVEWRGDEPRTAETWCMARCSGDGDCRQGAGYRCVREGELDEDGNEIPARVVDLGDRRNKGFCAATMTDEEM